MMQFGIDKTDFIKVLQRIQGIVEKRNTMPILANVLLEAKDGHLNASATDLEIYIKDTSSASVKKEGSVTVNARKLFEVIKQLPEESVNIEVKEGEKLTIKSGKARFNIVGLPTKEFPPAPNMEEAGLVKIEAEVLRDMIDKTAIAVSTDEVRYNINGFFIDKDEEKTRLVTTDGHRLAIMEKEGVEITAAKKGVILPRKGVGEMRRLLEEKDGAFFLGITEKSATLKRDETLINTRLIEGEFPDFKQVMPKDNDKEIKLDRSGFLEALKRVSILSTEKIKGVKFSFSDKKLVLSSSSPDIGDATEELDVDYKGEALEIAFNAKYFIDALEVIEQDKVKLLLKDSLSSGILSPESSSEYTYIVMPMRLRQLEETSGN